MHLTSGWLRFWPAEVTLERGLDSEAVPSLPRRPERASAPALLIVSPQDSQKRPLEGGGKKDAFPLHPGTSHRAAPPRGRARQTAAMWRRGCFQARANEWRSQAGARKPAEG